MKGIATAHEVPQIEAAERDTLIRQTVSRCYQGSAFYRERMDAVGVQPGDIRGIDDLESLPVMLRKADELELQERSRSELGHPFGEHLCVPPDEVVAVSSTSGTTGTPTFYAFTRGDVAVTDLLWARGLRQAGIDSGSVVVQGFGLSMYLAGYPLARAVERMGAQIVPVGAEVGSDRLLAVASLVGADVLLATPSYVTYLIDRDPDRLRSLRLRSIVCAGEPGAGLTELRSRIERTSGATVYDVLGGAHGILNASDGSHPYQGMIVLSDDCSVQQLIDPDSGVPVQVPHDGRPAYGERVKTSLIWEAQPQLRASVGDIYEMRRVQSESGPITLVRVIGRTDDLLIVKGVKIYPAAVRNLVAEFVPRVTGELRILVRGEPPRIEPPLRLRIERGAEAQPEDDRRLADDLAQRMHERLTVRPSVDVVDPGALERTAHKATLIERIR